MFKEFIHKATSFVLVFLLLITTASFSIQKRYCHDNLVDISVFSLMEDCKTNASVKPIINCEIAKCCIDKVDVFQGEEVIKSSTDYNVNKLQKCVITAFVYSYFDFFNDASGKQSYFEDYSPPEPYLNKQVLHQVFII